MKKLFRAFLPDENEIFDDYTDEDFKMREHEWAIVGRVAVIGGGLFLLYYAVFRFLNLM